MSTHSRTQPAKRRLDSLICKFAQRLNQSAEYYWRLINAVRAHSKLLTAVSNRGSTDPQEAARILTACVRMANRWQYWQRQPEAWLAPHANPFVQFRSLVGHLFDEYPVPKFMAPVWMDVNDNPWELEMYLHLAAGRSIRQFRLPVPFRLTKQAAGFFVQAPDDLPPLGALRWAHVRSLGGNPRMARLLCEKTLLAAPTEHEAFWETVIRFLVSNAPICADEVLAIVQFLDNQRFQPAAKVWGPGAGEQPLQPEFTIKGRSLNSLRRHMTHWREELASTRPAVLSTTPDWEKTNIAPFRDVQGDTMWTINELLTDKELRVEGGIMQHCVATYIHICARRRTSIWSLRVHQGERQKRLLTIEVVPATRMIWQAKGKRNSPPTERAQHILQQWAAQEGLTFRETA